MICVSGCFSHYSDEIGQFHKLCQQGAKIYPINSTHIQKAQSIFIYTFSKLFHRRRQAAGDATGPEGPRGAALLLARLAQGTGRVALSHTAHRWHRGAELL